MTDTLATRLRKALGPDYTLERELGGGGMSRVFVATESALGRRVVVKVLPPDLAAGVNKERFRREIQLAAQLQHPHVVPLLTAGERDELLWFTMPFIEGESLRVTLDERKRLPVREVLRILRNVVDALAYAHGRGVVHRDIKPANILMSGSHAVVTDFGVAKALSAAIPIAGHTTSGMAIGTPAYMAPEQLAADPAADHRVDIYAIGLLAYELLTGIAPFSGSSPQATLAAQLTVRPTAPHITQPDIPPALSALIMHCLEKDAAKRPQTASALLHELDAVEAAARDEAASAAYRQSVRSRRAVMVVVGLLIAATGAYAIANGRSASEAASAPGGDSVARSSAPETVVVFRDVSELRDEARGVPLSLGLSRAESLQIAEQITGGAPSIVQQAQTGAPIIDRDSLIAAVSRVFSDSLRLAMKSMATALSALPRQQQLQSMVVEPARGAVEGITPLLPPPPRGTHRLAIMSFDDRTRDSSLASLGPALLDSIAAALHRTRSGRLDVLPAEVTRKLVGEKAANQSAAVGFALRANYVLSGVYFVRNDSIVIITALTDVQHGAATRLHAEHAPLARATAALAPSATWARARLDSLRRDAVTRDPGRRPPSSSGRQEPAQP